MSIAPRDVVAAGRSWPVDESTVRGLVRRLDRERRARQAAEQLAEDATRAAMLDALTGLPNRRWLVDAGHTTGHEDAAVCFVDLDHFKTINDTWGHECGDAALVEVGHRLRGAVRPGDFVGRLGGDEFVCVLWDVHEVGVAHELAERVVRALGAPYHDRAGAHLPLGGSVGVAVGVVTDGLEPLLRDADAASRAAKRAGRGQVIVFDGAVRDGVVDRRDLEADLREALADGSIAVHYQPVFSLRSMAVTGVEALARWDHPVRGPVSPAVFVPLAERSGLVHLLDEHVLHRSLHDLADVAGLGVNVNLSAVQLQRPDLCERVDAQLRGARFDPSRLCLEITESALLSAEPIVVENVEGLCGLGCRVAIDDFGTGHSSLAHLERLPVDVVKIDRSFVAGVAENPRSAAIVQAVLGMARALGLEVVAEGIETQAQRDHLLASGGRSGQGWLLTPALPLPALLTFLESRRAPDPVDESPALRWSAIVGESQG